MNAPTQRISWKDTLQYAPTCPISSGQPVPGARTQVHGVPWVRAAQQIPWATDLRSAIAALNAMARLIADILHAGPHINNVGAQNPKDVVEQGQNNNPNYKNADWIQEDRVYKKQKLVNPDDEGQFIEIKVITSISFVNQNTSYRLEYGE